MPKRTMLQTHYGIIEPVMLLEKLEFDALQLSNEPIAYNVFNFLVTASSLNEWTRKVYKGQSVADSISDALKKKDFTLLTTLVTDWIEDKNCLPNKHCDVRRHIYNVINICWDTANASKHFDWPKSRIRKIKDSPIIENYYQFFFSSREPDLYFDYGGESYSMSQIKDILLQFYRGALTHLIESQEKM